MHDASKQVPSEQSGPQRAVVLLVLAREDGIARPVLNAELNDLRTDVINQTLKVLMREGVVVAGGEGVRASRCVRHLDALSLICV